MRLKITNLNVLNLFYLQKPNITFLNNMFSQNLWYTLRLPFYFILFKHCFNILISIFMK